jgi:hypothetical protein
MFLIYWTEVQNEVAMPASKEFPSNEMGPALTFSESLRARRRAGEEISHIVMSSENPNSVGQAGVGVTDSSYDWKKRRQ